MPAPAPMPYGDERVYVRSIMDGETARVMARYLIRELECIECAIAFLDNIERELWREAAALPKHPRPAIGAKAARRFRAS